MKIYLAGCGQIGSRLGEQLACEHDMVGLKRSKSNFLFPLILMDLLDAKKVATLPCDADAIIFTVTPSRYDESGYREVYDNALGNVIEWASRHEKQHKKPPLVLLVSSTGVYGQQDGQWVDENSETKPTSDMSRWIVKGEEQLTSRLDNVIIVRFSGIYGAGRMRLITNATSGKPIQQNPPMWTNRIHEDDTVGVLAFLLEQYQQGRDLDNVYLASDDAPVSQYDVCAFICEQMKQPAPPIKNDELTNACNKRCDNSRLKNLGYEFSCPTYKKGYIRPFLAHRLLYDKRGRVVNDF